jgi:GABA(A) receptor-associated protein
MENKFKLKSTFEKRKQESDNIKQKYPDRIPIIVQKHAKSTLNDVDKCKYLVPKDMTMGQFLFVVRKRVKLGPEQALFITVNGTLVSSVKTINDIYCDLSDEDGFLYVIYTNENTFG